MPSPIAHIAAGYALYRIAVVSSRPLPGRRNATGDAVDARIRARRRKFLLPPGGARSPRLLAFLLFTSLFPDLDSGIGLLKGDFAGYHHSILHNLSAGVLYALAALALAGSLEGIRGEWKPEHRPWIFALGALCAYELHIVMDLFTVSDGMDLLQPFSDRLCRSPLRLFYGLRWSEGLLSVHHIRTVISEVATSLAAIIVIEKILGKPPPGSES